MEKEEKKKRVKKKPQKVESLKEPYRRIDWEEIRELASLHFSVSKIASALRIQRCTLYERCIKDNGIELPELMEQSRDYGEIQLMKSSVKNAIENNHAGLQMFFLKNWCGYKDRQDITTNDQAINKPVIQVYDMESAEVINQFINKVSEGKDDENNEGIQTER